MKMANMPAFELAGATRFNSFSASDFMNVLVSGILIFYVLTELNNTAETFLYRSRNINKRSVDRYIIYSRISSMRGTLSLLRGLEWPPDRISTEKSVWLTIGHPSIKPGQNMLDDDNRVETVSETEEGWNGIPEPQRRFSKLIVPCLTRVILLLAELGAIYCSANVPKNVYARSGFDARLSTLEGSPLNVRSNNLSRCKGFVQPARRIEQSGDLLLCVHRLKVAAAKINQQHGTMVDFDYKMSANGQNYLITDEFAESTLVGVEVRMSLIQGDDVFLAPLRPDLEDQHGYGQKLITLVLAKAMRRLGVKVQGRFSNPFKLDDETMRMSFPQNFSQDGERIATALFEELQTMSLALNSTGAPWIHDRDSGMFMQRNDMVIAIVGLNRMAHGILLVIGLSLTVCRVLLQRWWLVFPEVAYMAMNKVLEENRRSAGNESIEVTKFSDGCVGHIGFQPSNSSQIPVERFTDCEIVL